MSRQISIFQFKGFKRTIIVHQSQVLDISNQLPQRRKLLKCPHCDEAFIRANVKCKHLNKCVKEINTNRSNKIEFKLVQKQDNFEVKEFLEKMADHVVKSEKEVIEVAYEDERPAANNRRGIVPFTVADLKFVKDLRWSLF